MWIIHSGNISLFELKNHALDSKRICSNHFTEDQVKSIDAKGMRKLKIEAIPIDKATLTDSDGLDNVDEQIGYSEIDLPSLNNALDDDNLVNDDDIIDNIEAPELIKNAKPVILNVENASLGLQII